MNKKPTITNMDHLTDMVASMGEDELRPWITDYDKSVLPKEAQDSIRRLLRKAKDHESLWWGLHYIFLLGGTYTSAMNIVDKIEARKLPQLDKDLYFLITNIVHLVGRDEDNPELMDHFVAVIDQIDITSLDLELTTGHWRRNTQPVDSDHETMIHYAHRAKNGVFTYQSMLFALIAALKLRVYQVAMMPVLENV